MARDKELVPDPVFNRGGVKVSKSPWGPDDEIGKSSVRPCVTPSVNACQSPSLPACSPKSTNASRAATSRSSPAAGYT